MEGDGFEPSVPGAREPVILRKVNCAGIDGAAKKFGGVPKVRIHLAPAKSLRTFGSSRNEEHPRSAAIRPIATASNQDQR
jgi:hypothetical protein